MLWAATDQELDVRKKLSIVSQERSGLEEKEQLFLKHKNTY